ncbi:GMC family oxidoreductase N-terminal domain-containing protein [Veronia nyctiphanis]|nr:GMC family oxidoreductase N-terminal domain-containing protein [Veronia nyctiphanis]
MPSEGDLECETLIIGSGAGGGVVASTLAEKGMDVMVVERGAYIPRSERNNREFEMVSRMYADRGMLTTNDQAISLFAGQNLGGGTSVNWSVSLRPTEPLLNEWAREHDLPHLLTPEFSQCIDDVCEQLNVVPEVPHNRQNQMLLTGSECIGGPSGPLPQNVRGCEKHGYSQCGYCLFGCRNGFKRDVTEACFNEKRDTGDVRIHDNVEIKRLVHRNGNVLYAEAVARSSNGELRSLKIRAKRYVVSAGGIFTPACC